MKGKTGGNTSSFICTKESVREHWRKVRKAKQQTNVRHGDAAIHKKVKLPAGPVAVAANGYPAATVVDAESAQQLTHLVQVLMKENAAFLERLRMFTPAEWKARERERKLEAATAKSADELSD
jgi:hypothetical protein